MGAIKLYYGPGKCFPEPGPGEYPLVTICAAVVFLCLSPFISGLLVYPALALCLLRMVLYDVRVFSIDIALLSSFSTLFRMGGGDSLLSYYVIAGVLWYSFRQRQWWAAGLICLLVMLAYLIVRMKGQFVTVVLIFSGLMSMQLVLVNQTKLSTAKMSGAFCAGLLVSCIYSLLLRHTWQLKAILGHEVPAYFGSHLTRFQGLFQDPNYFSVCLLLGVLLMFRLGDYGYIKRVWSWLVIGVFGTCGILTYSKTFFIFFVVLAIWFVVVLFQRKQRFWGFVIILVGAAATAGSVFAVVGERILSATDMSDLSTGRTELFVKYLEAVMASGHTFLFGYGLDAPYLRLGPHNLYIEITYYLGAIGLFLYAVYFFMLLFRVRNQAPGRNKDRFMRYAAPALLLAVYFTLQGVLATTFYILMAVALASVRLERLGE